MGGNAHIILLTKPHEKPIPTSVSRFGQACNVELSLVFGTEVTVVLVSVPVFISAPGDRKSGDVPAGVAVGAFPSSGLS